MKDQPIYFHEKYAAEICNTTVEEMFSKKRKMEAVLARNLCMNFISENKFITQAENAGRFRMDHSSVPAARKKLQNWTQTNLELKQKLDKYMSVCTNKKREEDNELYGVNTIIQDGLDVFLSNEKDILLKLFNTLSGFGKGNATDEEVLTCVEEVEKSLVRIRYNFSK